MAPRPDFESMVNQYSNTRRGVVPSPTTVTNAIRNRPKAPHHPRSGYAYNHRGKPRLAAPSSQTTGLSPSDKNGSFASMGRSVLACTSPSNDQASHSFTKDYGATSLQRKNLKVCLDTTAVAAGDFAVTTAEIYRQECRSDGRGRENLHVGSNDKFLRQKRSQSNLRGGQRNSNNAGSPDDNSLTESLHFAERRDILGEDSRRKRYGKIPGAEPEGLPSRRNLYVDINEFHEEERAFDITPPRVDRTSGVNEFAPRAERGNIEEAQMELFQLGNNSPSAATENKLARALQDLKRQDKVIEGWKRQLEMTQKHLDDAFTDLEKTKKDSQEKQRKAAEVRARVVRDRKKLQDLYDAEVEQRKKLEENVSKLQNEISTLKVTLRNARGSSAATMSPSPRNISDAANKSQIVALKAEIVDLKSQMAEAHAMSIDDHSALHSTAEVDELKRKLNAAEAELEQLRSKDEDIQAVRKNYEDSVRLLNEKLERIEKDSKNTQTKLEANLKAAVDEENQVRTELHKFKANCQRLERERSRTRVHSAADIERLNRQLSAARDEVARLKQQLSNAETSAKEESEKLKHEMADLRQQLKESGHEFSENESMTMEDRTKLKLELKNLKEEVEMRKQQLRVKSEEVTSQAIRIAELESSSKSKGLPPSPHMAEMQQLRSLQNEVQVLKLNETSLRDEITKQQKMVEQERKETIKAESLRRAQSVNETVRLDQLRQELEEYKQLDEKRLEQDALIGKLQKQIADLEEKVDSLKNKPESEEVFKSKLISIENAYKNEIEALKTKLLDAEKKYGEECFRSEEERRRSREGEGRHIQELDEVRRENDRIVEEKLKLRDELEELRKQLIDGISGVREYSQSSERPEGSSKVNKLRSELALARARLAAAREQTGKFAPNESTSDLSTSQKNDDGQSHQRGASFDFSSASSQGSTWVPNMTAQESTRSLSRDRYAKMKEDNAPLDEETPIDESEDSPLEDIPLENNTIEEKKEDDHSCHLQKSTVIDAMIVEAPSDEPTQSGRLSRKALSYSRTSLIDAEDDKAAFSDSLPLSSLAKESEKISQPSSANRASVTELRRQLLESSKRLEQANSRLNSLAGQDLPSAKSANAFTSSPFRGINYNIFASLDDHEASGGILEEVVTSEIEGIEVQRVRYADI